MRLFKILKKPVQTEKASNVEMKNNTYVFIVSPDATKIDIKKAVFAAYGVQVASVNILNTREKFKYGRRRNLQLKKNSQKKAYVTLKDEKAKIDFSLIK